jgi:hypothetical protein
VRSLKLAQGRSGFKKELIREWEAMPVGDAIQAGIRSIVRAYETEEPRRLVGAAIERMRRRKP